ncbi:MAG: hypothetical protein DI589_06620 [Shinella sp.]|nr:MAG: hypothetical protein DI589_06620 [Shinella sp.]
MFGGGDNTASKEAARSRELQSVANDRQLSEANRNTQAVAATRRAPRGRRLFEDGGSSSSSAVLG